jgi:hypothetical protein
MKWGFRVELSTNEGTKIGEPLQVRRRRSNLGNRSGAKVKPQTQEAPTLELGLSKFYYPTIIQAGGTQAHLILCELLKICYNQSLSTA